MHYPVYKNTDEVTKVFNHSKCIISEDKESIDESIIQSTGQSYYKAYTDAIAMAEISREISKMKNNPICTVPFCVSIGAEGFGASVSISDDKCGPQFNGYRYKSVEELAQIKDINLASGRVNEVLKSIENLSGQGKIVALNIEGPFTILALLIDTLTLFHGIKYQKKTMERVLKTIENGIIDYILLGIKKGAKIISYADPTGALEIVGPEIYSEISGNSTYNVLKGVESHIDRSVIHVCSKTSLAFEKLGFCKSTQLDIIDQKTYGEAICSLINDEKVKFIGHRCIKAIDSPLGGGVIWQLGLSCESPSKPSYNSRGEQKFIENDLL